ncbi:MAG: DUF4388 domain-containing protein [Frankiaceae bacterium]|nr:DUF4388 domain-containing protein [Frankiaceae bacterium]
MRLEGSLDAFSLPDIFALLSMTKKTGGLHLRRAGAHGVVWFTTGALTGGASDVGRQAFARRVVGSGLVTDDALAAAVDRTVADESLGVVRALQQAGAVDEGALHDIGGEHVIDTVFDLLRWPDGDFAFVVDEPNPDDVGISRQVDDVVAESRRRLDQWGKVATTLPSPQSVLSIVTNPAADPVLTRDEWSLLALVDGRRSVAAIVGLAGRGEFSVASSLADLVERGLLRTADGDESGSLTRRHELLARLEGAAPSAPEPPVAAAPAAPVAPAPVVVEEVVMDGSDDDYDDEDDDLEDVAPVAPVRSIGSGKAEITPKRPEPFLPPRQPDHPEEPMPAVAAVAGGAPAPTPAAASYIERDPSVNKSLLLRLIAGVRGL